jgi:hypothetical protein
MEKVVVDLGLYTCLTTCCFAAITPAIEYGNAPSCCSVVANQARCRIKSGMTNKDGAQT